MKKVLSFLVVLTMVLALGVSMSAGTLENLPSDVDTQHKIGVGEPVVDGMLDEGVYTKVYHIAGQDVMDATPGLGGKDIGYKWFMIPQANVKEFIENGNQTEYSKYYMAQTYADGYAAWSGDYLYVCIEVFYGDTPFSGAPAAEPFLMWMGHSLQFSFDRIDADFSGEFDEVHGRDVEFYFGYDLDEGTFVHLINENPYGITADDVELKTVNNSADTITYEARIDISKMDLSTCGNEFYFCVAHNFNIADAYDDDDWFGYEVGCGCFTIGKKLSRYPEEEGLGFLNNSMTMVLTGESGGNTQPVHTHKAGTEWKTDGENHWNVCSCGEVMNKDAHKGGEATWEKKAVCDVCSAEYGELAEKPHEHAAEGQWKTDGDNHWKVCSCGEIMEKGDHKGGSATTEAKAKCDVCGASYGELAEPDHVHAAEAEWKTDGETHWKACECGEIMETAAHTGGTATTEAKAQCEVCGAEYGELAEAPVDPDPVDPVDPDPVDPVDPDPVDPVDPDPVDPVDPDPVDPVDPDPVDPADPVEPAPANEFPVVPVAIGAAVLVIAIIVVAIVLSKKKK